MPFTSNFSTSAGSTTAVATGTGNQAAPGIAALSTGNSAVFYVDGTALKAQLINSLTGALFGTAITVAANVATSTDANGYLDETSVAVLTNGNIVVAWVDPAAPNDLVQAIYSPTLGVVLSATSAIIPSSATVSRPDIAALDNGSYVIVWEFDYGGGDHDITFRRFDSSGSFIGGATLDLSTLYDERPTVAATDGGFLIGFDRLNAADNSTQLYTAQYTNAGAGVGTLTVADSTGTINRGADFAGRTDVDLAVRMVWEDNEYAGPQTDPHARIYGTATNARLSTATQNDGALNAALSRTGFTLVTGTFQFGANDSDIRSYLINPAGSIAATASAASSTQNESTGAVTWINDSQARVAFSTFQTSIDVDGGIATRLITVTRTTTGDAAGDTINFRTDGLFDLVNAGAGNDVVLGGDGDDVLNGQADNDVLAGDAGDDILNGGTGSNELYGGIGNDTFRLFDGTGSTVIELANEGTDTVLTTLNSYTIPSNVENLSFNGTGNFVGIGNALDNVIDAGSGNDSLGGGDGNDTLISRGGSDELVGGLGNDIYVVLDRISSTFELANQGTDTLQTTVSIYVLQNNIENLTFTDNADHLAGIGNDLNNVLTGNTGRDDMSAAGGNDTLYGGTGTANTLIGGTGDDTYYVDAAGDSIIEYLNEGNDSVITTLNSFSLRPNLENVTFFGTGAFAGVGSADNNRITGFLGDDSLAGGDGNDILFGGGGSDILQGNAGSDTFRYSGGGGLDRILDFTAGQDKIEIFGLFFGSFGGPVTFEANGSGTATTANATFTYNVNNGIVSYDADGTGAAAATALAQLNTGLTLSINDFVRSASAPVRPDFAPVFESDAAPSIDSMAMKYGAPVWTHALDDGFLLA